MQAPISANAMCALWGGGWEGVRGWMVICEHLEVRADTRKAGSELICVLSPSEDEGSPEDWAIWGAH